MDVLLGRDESMTVSRPQFSIFHPSEKYTRRLIISRIPFSGGYVSPCQQHLQPFDGVDNRKGCGDGDQRDHHHDRRSDELHRSDDAVTLKPRLSHISTDAVHDQSLLRQSVNGANTAVSPAQ